MRTSDEKFLVGFANDCINRLGICPPKPKPDFVSFKEDVEFTHGVRISHLLMEMSNAKLGIIAGLLLFSEKEYESAEFLQTQLTQTQVTYKNFDVLDGHRQLVALALPVVIAAMYDIIIAKRFLKEKASLTSLNNAERAQTSPWPHVPKLAMRKFLKKSGIPIG